MSIELTKKGVLVCCTLLLAELVGTATADGQTSVLSRVQTIDDPQLGELIRVALENLPETKRLRQMRPYEKGYQQTKEAEETAKHRTVRLVTEAYTQIKLLDSQIEQSDAKVGSSSLPEALARELILAKAELESQRATKLAELREIMHIIPRHALGRKPVKDLNGWLNLDVIGDSVLVFTGAKPFANERPMRDVFVKLMSRKEAKKYALDYVGEPNHWPVRVDILRNLDGVKFSEELEKELIREVKRSKLELEFEVHLSEGVPRGSREGYLFLVKGRIGARISQDSKTYQGRRIITKKLSGLIDPNDFDGYFRGWLVGGPARLPAKFNIEYDEESKDLALRTAKAIEDTAKKFGVEKFVEVVQKQADFDDVK